MEPDIQIFSFMLYNDSNIQNFMQKYA